MTRPHDEPPPLLPRDNRTPGVPPRLPTIQTKTVVFRFFAGLLLGAAVSAIVWIAGWKPLMEHGSGTVILVVPGLKLAAGIVGLCLRGWRSFGAGILVSIAVGMLIFFGVCASSGTH